MCTIAKQKKADADNGLDEENALIKAEELAEKQLPVEEVLRRRQELRRQRELLFREVGWPLALITELCELVWAGRVVDRTVKVKFACIVVVILICASQSEAGSEGKGGTYGLNAPPRLAVYCVRNVRVKAMTEDDLIYVLDPGWS